MKDVGAAASTVGAGVNVTGVHPHRNRERLVFGFLIAALESGCDVGRGKLTVAADLNWRSVGKGYRQRLKRLIRFDRRNREAGATGLRLGAQRQRDRPVLLNNLG